MKNKYYRNGCCGSTPVDCCGGDLVHAFQVQFVGSALHGNDGLSAFEIAVKHGFIGTEEQWLASLKGAKGDGSIEWEDF